MSYVKKVHGKPRLQVCQPIISKYGSHLARLHRRRHRRRRRLRAYALTSNTASHDNHEQITSRFSFNSLCSYWVEIIRVILKSNGRAARGRFEITSMISD